MKKILLSILIVLLLILTYVVLAKGINIGFIKISSIENIKSESETLDANLDKANELSNKTYPAEVKGLEEAIRKLKISKQEYENKKKYSVEDEILGTVEIKTYTIHYLWTILGNYRGDRGVRALTLDLIETENKDVYDLDFTLEGSYTNITDFLYDIENDEQLNFEIKNFVISSTFVEETKKDNANKENADTANTGKNENTNNINNTINTNNILINTNINGNKNSNTNEDNAEEEQKGKTTDGNILQARFTVENVGITLE